jgi:hypothetical protein
MRYSLVTLLPLTLALTACGNDSGQQAAAPATPVESSAPAAADATAAVEAAASDATAAMATAPVVADEATAAPLSDDEVVYDPIDVAKLQSTWWQQFNK